MYAPPIGPLPLRFFVLAALLAALAAAAPASAKSSAGCGFEEEPFGRMPATTAEQLDQSVLASYAVLRRPAAAVDQPPPINSLAEQVDFALGRYNPAYLRQLTQRPGGRRFFLVPGFPIHVPIPPRRCLPPRLPAAPGARRGAAQARAPADRLRRHELV